MKLLQCLFARVLFVHPSWSLSLSKSSNFFGPDQ
jgi:hypothetical protein